MAVIVCLWPKQQPKNQFLGSHCVYLPTYLMLKRKLLSVVFDMKNKNVEPLNKDVSCRKKNEMKRVFKNQ